MLAALSFELLLTLARFAVLLVGAAALAAWALRLPDQTTELIASLRKGQAKRAPQTGPCPPQTDNRPKPTGD